MFQFGPLFRNSQRRSDWLKDKGIKNYIHIQEVSYLNTLTDILTRNG